MSLLVPDHTPARVKPESVKTSALTRPTRRILSGLLFGAAALMAVPVVRLMAQTGETAEDPAPTTETEVLVEEIVAAGTGIAPEPAPEPEAQPTPTPEPALPAPVFAPSSPEVKEAPPVQPLAAARPEVILDKIIATGC
jgi:type IV secretory pathway VirB10-like protein